MRDRGVDSRIKLRVNSMARGKGTGDAWGIAVRKQLGGSAPQPRVEDVRRLEKRRFQEEWKKKVEYGKRWLVEIVFSAFKRMFGEHLYSLKWKNMVQEVRIKVATYNRLVDMGAGAGVRPKYARPVHVLSEQGELCNTLDYTEPI